MARPSSASSPPRSPPPEARARDGGRALAVQVVRGGDAGDGEAVGSGGAGGVGMNVCCSSSSTSAVGCDAGTGVGCGVGRTDAGFGVGSAASAGGSARLHDRLLRRQRHRLQRRYRAGGDRGNRGLSTVPVLVRLASICRRQLVVASATTVACPALVGLRATGDTQRCVRRVSGRRRNQQAALVGPRSSRLPKFARSARSVAGGAGRTDGRTNGRGRGRRGTDGRLDGVRRTGRGRRGTDEQANRAAGAGRPAAWATLPLRGGQAQCVEMGSR